MRPHMCGSGNGRLLGLTTENDCYCTNRHAFIRAHGLNAFCIASDTQCIYVVLEIPSLRMVTKLGCKSLIRTRMIEQSFNQL